MSDDLELLEQRVTKHRTKLDRAAQAVALTRQHMETAQAADKASQRELTAAESALVTAKAKVLELKERRAAAREIAGATTRERLETEQEHGLDTKKVERRQGKLAKAEAALAAAQAIERVEATTPAPRKRAPARKATPTAGPPATRTAAKRAATKTGATKTGATKTGATKTGATKTGATKTGATKGTSSRTTRRTTS